MLLQTEKLQITSSDSFCEINILFADITIKLHYHQSERFPFEIESILTKEDHLFPQRSKCKVGFGEKEKQLFYHHDLPFVISQLLSLSVSF